jgi:RNA recognition motif-containing protein
MNCILKRGDLIIDTIVKNKNINIIKYKGKEILYVDFSNKASVRNKEEILNTIDEAKKIIKMYAPNSCLIITNLTKTGFDKEISEAFKNYSKHNTPFVKASALIGIAGMQKLFLDFIRKVTRRNFYLTNDLDKAKEWVINQ